jgi:hypothetical protein
MKIDDEVFSLVDVQARRSLWLRRSRDALPVHDVEKGRGQVVTYMREGDNRRERRER